MKDCACQKAPSANSEEEVTEETLRAIAAERLERLNFQRILAGKDAEIAFLEKTLADQERICVKSALLCGELSRKEESFFEELVLANKEIDKLEARIADLEADRNAQERMIVFLIRAKKSLDEKLGMSRREKNATASKLKIANAVLSVADRIAHNLTPGNFKMGVDALKRTLLSDLIATNNEESVLVWGTEFVRKLQQQDSGETEVDPLHLQLEAEICDRNPPPVESFLG